MYWGTGRDCRCSGVRRGSGGIGAPWGVGAISWVRGIRGCIEGWQGL